MNSYSKLVQDREMWHEASFNQARAANIKHDDAVTDWLTDPIKILSHQNSYSLYYVSIFMSKVNKARVYFSSDSDYRGHLSDVRVHVY